MFVNNQLARTVLSITIQKGITDRI